jgi:predicted GH43/DUF377 family glycosyl hydrolase
MALDVGTGWESAHVWRPSVIYDGSSFMMWYSGENTQGVDNVGLATSTDGIKWARHAANPVLRVGRPGSWDANSVQAPWVIHENGVYKMWFEGQTFTSGNVAKMAIGYATSPNGVDWTKYSGNPVLTPGPSGTWDDKWTYRPVVISTGQSYVMYYRSLSSQGTTGETGMAISDDGIHWTKRASPISIPPSSSGWDSYLWALGSVATAGGVFVMWYHGTRGSDANGEIGCANSTDGIVWNVYPNNPVITYGPKGSWDEGGTYHPMTVNVGDKYYVYYNAYRAPHHRVGLAILPMSEYQIPEFPWSVSVATIALTIAALAIRRKRAK